MKIEIKKSTKLIEYKKAIDLLEKRLIDVNKNKLSELIWILEHPNTYTAGTGFDEKDILDKSIKVVKTSRGGKITWHGPGQLVCYFVINLNNRKKDIRKFLNIIENSIITSLKKFGISSYSDRKNIGIWTKINNKEKKIGAIGIRVKKWIAYHGFSVNITSSMSNYKKIIPCGIKDKEITSLKKINNQNYNKFSQEIIKNLLFNLKN